MQGFKKITQLALLIAREKSGRDLTIPPALFSSFCAVFISSRNSLATGQALVIYLTDSERLG